MDLVTEDLHELTTKLMRARDGWNLVLASEAAMNDLLDFFYETDFGSGTVDDSAEVPDRSKDVYLAAFRKLMPIMSGYPNQELVNVIKSCVDKLISRNTWGQFDRTLNDFLAHLQSELSVTSEVKMDARDQLHDCRRKLDEGRLLNLDRYLAKLPARA